MLFQIIKRCIQNSSYRKNSFKINVRSLCQISTDDQKILKTNTGVKHDNISKSKYVGYEVIYKYPLIKYISLYNKAKRNMLIGTFMTMPVMFTLGQMNIMSENSALCVSTCACMFTLSLYVTGILFDHHIGFIYYKNNKAIKIAYVDAWGRRVDIDTSVQDIKSLNECSPAITDKLYKTIHLKSLKFPLKLIVKNGIIFDEDKLVSILGDYK